MRTIKYDEQEKGTGNTQTHIAADTAMNDNYDSHKLAEGFAASDGVWSALSEGGDRVAPRSGDDSIPPRTPDSIREENPGLADN